MAKKKYIWLARDGDGVEVQYRLNTKEPAYSASLKQWAHREDYASLCTKQVHLFFFKIKPGTALKIEVIRLKDGSVKFRPVKHKGG